MDIENFDQCISYMAAITNKKDLFETIFPMMTSLIGIAIGFGLNQASEYIKNKKTTRNKKTCIDEEIYRIRQGVGQSFKECLLLMDKCIKKERSIGHNIPSEIDSPFIDEYFASVAHSYSQVERHYVLLVRPAIRELNKNLEAVVDATAPGDFDFMSRACLNSINSSAYCFSVCSSFLSDAKKLPITNGSEQPTILLADLLGVQSVYIEKLRSRYKSEKV